MSIRPLTAQCLIEMLPPQSETDGGLVIPEKAQEKAVKGIVREIGQWPKAKNGLHHLPEFHVGQTVIVSKHSGTKLRREFYANFRICKQRDILAIVEETSPQRNP